jgi:hypothetical protein
MTLTCRNGTHRSAQTTRMRRAGGHPPARMSTRQARRSALVADEVSGVFVLRRTDLLR